MAGFLCPYCGDRGKRSGEHVLPRWAARKLGISDSKIWIHGERALGYPQPRTRASIGFDLRIPACETCNNGWLANLEVDFSECFGDILLGVRTTIDTGNVELFVRWAVKTALHLQVLAIGLGDKGYPSPSHLAELRVGIPELTMVWIGCFDFRDPRFPTPRYAWQHSFPLLLDPANPQMDPVVFPDHVDRGHSGYVSFYSIGALLVQVLGAEIAIGDVLLVGGVPSALRAVKPPDHLPYIWPDRDPVDIGWMNALVNADPFPLRIALARKGPC